MRKILSRLVLGLGILGAPLTFVGCTEEKPAEAPKAPEPTPAPTPPPAGGEAPKTDGGAAPAPAPAPAPGGEAPK
jgi:chitinase